MSPVKPWVLYETNEQKNLYDAFRRELLKQIVTKLHQILRKVTVRAKDAGFPSPPLAGLLMPLIYKAGKKIFKTGPQSNEQNRYQTEKPPNWKITFLVITSKWILGNYQSNSNLQNLNLKQRDSRW